MSYATLPDTGSISNPTSYDRNVMQKFYHCITSLRHKIQGLILIQAGAKLLLSALALAILSFVADYYLILPWAARFILFISMMVVMYLVVYRVLCQPLQVQLSDEDLVLALEKSNPHLEERLIAAVQFSRLLDDPDYADSKIMSQQVIQDMDSLLPQINFNILRYKETLLCGLACCLTLGLLGLVHSFFPNLGSLANTWMKRNVFLQEVSWPRRTHLFLLKENFVAIANQPLTIVAKGQIFGDIVLWQLPEKKGFAFWEPFYMESKSAEGSSLVLPKLEGNFYFYLEQQGSPISCLYRVIASEELGKEPSPIVLNLPDHQISKARGQNLYLRIFAKGVVPRTAYIVAQFANGRTNEDQLMSQEKGFFKYDFTMLMEDFSFCLQGGDDQDEIPLYEVQVLNPPSTEAVSVWLQYPQYTGLAPTPWQTPLNDGNITALVGTQAIVRIKTNIPLKEANLTFQGKYESALSSVTFSPNPTVPELLQLPEFYYAQFQVQYDTRYKIELLAETMLTDPNPASYFIRALKDEPPLIQILEPKSREIKMCLTGSVPLSVLTKDDFGIQELGIRYRVQTEEWQEIKWNREQNQGDYGQQEIQSKYRLDPAIFLKIPPNEINKAEENWTGKTSIAIKVYGLDNATPPGLRESSNINLEIISRTELVRVVMEEIKGIKQQVRKVMEDQDERKRNLENFLANSTLEAADIGRALQLRFAQNAISRDIAMETQKLTEVIETIIQNDLWKLFPNSKEEIERAQQLLYESAYEEKSSIYQGLSNQIEKQIANGYQLLRDNPTQGRQALELALGQESQLIQQLQEVIQILKELEDFTSAVQDLEKLLESHSKLKQKLQQLLQPQDNK